MRSGPEAIIIADDLTGAADTGVQFTAIGSPVNMMPLESMLFGRQWTVEARSISVYTATRQLSAHALTERLQQLSRALSDLHPQWVYKKIDSCLRGNPGAEIDVLLDTLGHDAALVAPALPAQGRTTIGGIHRIYGRPLAETEFAKNPLSPITFSAVAGVLASQSRYPVGRIDIKEYDNPGRLQRAIQQEYQRGCRLIVCDAAEQAHLDQIAALVVQNATRFLPVGSAGLAAGLVDQLSPGKSLEPPPTPALKWLLLVCGTGSQVTRSQLDALFNKYPGTRHELEPNWLIESSTEDQRRYARELLAAWSSGILALTIGPLSRERPRVSLDKAIVGLSGLANLALAIVQAKPVDGLFLSGGETADAFLRMSSGEAIALYQEVLPGLVLGRWLGGIADGLPVVTKAGGFGQEQTLVALCERLCGES